MKKYLLATACLLTLTACSQTNQNQTKQESKPKQSQTQQSSKTTEETWQVKTFSTSIQNTTSKVKVYYQKDKAEALEFISSKAIPDEEKSKSPDEIKKTYQTETLESPTYKELGKLDGFKLETEVSADKGTVTQTAYFDLNKISPEKLSTVFTIVDEENSLIPKLKGKVEDLFEAIKKQGLTEE